MKTRNTKKFLEYLYSNFTGNFLGFVIGMASTRLVSHFFTTRSIKNLWGLTARKTVVDKQTFSAMEWAVSIIIGFIVFEVISKWAKKKIELWMNKGPLRHWLQLTLTGKKSNPSALGVKVICRGTRTQVGSVANSVGYASCSDLRVHFGVGDDRKVALEIHWPSGIVQKLADVPTDQLLNVDEPSTSTPAATTESRK